MQDFDTKTQEPGSSKEQHHEPKARLWDLIRYLIKRIVVFVSFGPGVLGVLWLLGRIFKR